ncbi:hypothetical protein DFH09DRAFT_1474810 [Mycena vulgaris]|nr:hypothetical protein DFH09DRAFT_1474810 [Mycena vulgaris]
MAAPPAPPPPRLTLDPSLESCDDHTSAISKPVRDLLVAGSAGSATPLTDADAAAQLTAVWTTGHDARQAAWDAQVQADADHATALADQAEADRLAAEAVAEAEHLEAEKKKPKLGAFMRLPLRCGVQNGWPCLGIATEWAEFSEAERPSWRRIAQDIVKAENVRETPHAAESETLESCGASPAESTVRFGYLSTQERPYRRAARGKRDGVAVADGRAAYDVDEERDESPQSGTYLQLGPIGTMT